jgi:membrane associated rhomboid family serine protease
MAFFHEPRGRGQPFLRAPFVVIALIAALTVAFAAYDWAPENVQADLIYRFALIPAGYSPAFFAAHPGLAPGSLFDRAVPFVSYIFLHASWEHLIVNSIWLLAFGPIVARRYGAVLFLIFFLLCGIAGAATHLALNWGSAAPVIGASAAIAGLMGAAFRMIGSDGLPGMLSGNAPLAPILSRRIVIWSAVWVAINVVAGLSGLGTGSTMQLIAWQAHLGGYFAGLFLATPFERFRPDSSAGGDRG